MPDILAPGGGGGGGPTNQVSDTVIQAVHGFATTQPIFFDGTDWQLAQANALRTLKHAVADVVDAGTFRAVYSGVITAAVHGFLAGTTQYVDAENPGEVTRIPPVGLQEFQQAAFEVLDDDRIKVIDQGVKFNTTSLQEMPIADLRYTSDMIAADGTWGPFIGNVGQTLAPMGNTPANITQIVDPDTGLFMVQSTGDASLSSIIARDFAVPFTLFGFWNFTDPTPAQSFVFDGADNNNRAFMFYNIVNDELVIGRAGGIAGDSPVANYAGGGRRVVGMRHGVDSATFYTTGGGTQVTNMTGGDQTFRFGNLFADSALGRTFSGQLGELLIYDYEVSDADFFMIIAELEQRWN